MEATNKVFTDKKQNLKMRQWGLHFFYISLIAFYVFGFEYVPAQDFPNLLYQGHIFSQLIFHGNNFGGLFFLYPYIPPNIISTVVIAIFDLFCDPIFSGKLYFLFLGVSFYWGINRYIKSFDIHYPLLVAALAFFLTFNLHYLAAYLNFMTGLAFVLHALATLRKNPKLEESLWYVGSVMLIVFLQFYRSRYFCGNISPGQLHTQEKVQPDFTKFAGRTSGNYYFYTLSFVRTINILPQAGGIDTRGIPEMIFEQMRNFLRVIIPFHHFKWITELSSTVVAFDYFFSAIILAGCSLILVHCILRKSYPLAFWLAGISLLSSILLPAYIGGVLLPGERFVIFCVINSFILYLSFKPPHVERKSSFIA